MSLGIRAHVPQQPLLAGCTLLLADSPPVCSPGQHASVANGFKLAYQLRKLSRKVTGMPRAGGSKGTPSTTCVIRNLKGRRVGRKR